LTIAKSEGLEKVFGAYSYIPDEEAVENGEKGESFIFTLTSDNVFKKMRLLNRKTREDFN